MPFNNNPSDYPIPSRFNVVNDSRGFSVAWKWFSVVHVLLLFFGIIWCGFLAVLYMLAFDNPIPGPMKFLILFFPLIHVAVGAGILYCSVCGFFNSTEIYVREGTLFIRHFPLPWPGNAQIPVSDIRQFYVTKKIRHSRKRGTSVHYALNLVDAAGRQKKLVSNLDEKSMRYLEHAFEKYLGISNQTVPGEHVSSL